MKNKIRIGLFSLLALFIFSCSTADKKDEKPNILFIMSDDHTSQAWGIYGGVLENYVKTPNISRLADEGVVLNNAFCTNSICVPSRASILTGQYSNKNGVFTLSGAMEPDSMNVSRVMKQNGYQTAIIGKWHLKKQPGGFDHFMVLPGQGIYHNPVLKMEDDWAEGGKTYEGFSSDVITDYSLKWLDERDKEKPFFLMTHFKATHEPFDYPERHNDLYVNEEIPEPESLFDFSPETTGRTFTGQKLSELARRYTKATQDPENHWTNYPGLPFSTEGMDSIQARKHVYQKFVKDFMRCGAAIDDNIGRIMNYLEENGLSENTVVIYTSDQGYFMGEHGFFDKRLMYEESLRMPFVMKYPKEIEPGTRIDDIVLNIDFPSLFIDYAGGEPPASMQGKSFRQNVNGKTPENWRDKMYYRYWAHAPVRPGHFGIRNERYKLIFFYGRGLGLGGASQKSTQPAWEFYDLKEDPKELNNAYGKERYKPIIEEMKKELIQLRKDYGDTDVEYPEMDSILTAHNIK